MGQVTSFVFTSVKTVFQFVACEQKKSSETYLFKRQYYIAFRKNLCN